MYFYRIGLGVCCGMAGLWGWMKRALGIRKKKDDVDMLARITTFARIMGLPWKQAQRWGRRIAVFQRALEWWFPIFLQLLFKGKRGEIVAIRGGRRKYTRSFLGYSSFFCWVSFFGFFSDDRFAFTSSVLSVWEGGFSGFPTRSRSFERHLEKGATL